MNVTNTYGWHTSACNWHTNDIKMAYEWHEWHKKYELCKWFGAFRS